MNNVSPVNTAMKYGAISGLVAFVLFIILWTLGKNPLGNWSIMGWAIPVIFTILAVRNYRDKDIGGYITYAQGLRTGMLLSIFSGFLYGVLIYASMVFFAGNICRMQADDYKTSTERLKETKLFSEETIDKANETTRDSFTPGLIAVSDFIAHIAGGLIVSLIVAGIYKRNPPPIDAGNISESNEN